MYCLMFGNESKVAKSGADPEQEGDVAADAVDRFVSPQPVWVKVYQ